MKVPEIQALGPDGILVRFSDHLEDAANRSALAFRARLEREAWDGVVETATSLTSVYLRFKPDCIKRAVLVRRFQEILTDTDWPLVDLPAGRTRWHIPAAFGGGFGPSMVEAANLAGLTPDEAVKEITEHPLRVLALGFAPGQPYLGFLPSHWDIPRQTAVTPQVPRGAIVTAVRQLIPFANAAPTGWRQIGQTAFRCYDPDAQPALPLRPGDEIRFHQITSDALQKLSTETRGGADAEVLS